MTDLQRAARYLAGVCDGAVRKDDCGFNRYDAGFGREMAYKENWTPRQTEAMRKMLRKYRGQLSGAGFDINTLFVAPVAPASAPKAATTPPTKLPTKRAVLVDGKIQVVFPFDWALVEIVKTLPGRKFNPEKKVWNCPISTEAVAILVKNGFHVAEEILAQIENMTKTVDEVEHVEMPALKRELFPFQQKGVAFIEAKGGRALVADEMGLGKTIQALAWLAMHPEKRPVVILVPAHLKLNWAQEIRKTMVGKQNVEILSGTKTHPITGDIVIVNYDILNDWLADLVAIRPQVLVFDEAHYIKNNSAQRTKATKKLAKGIPHVIALTGTPIVNRPIEGFNIAQIVNKNVFPNFWTFVNKYCGAHHNGFGWDFSGATNKEELHRKLVESIMIRRKKADVLPDLPEKLYTYVPMEITNSREYADAEEDFISYLQGEKGDDAAEKAKKAEHLVRIEGLKQICLRGKIKQATQWIRDFLDTNGNKLVVFAVHKTAIDALMAEFKDIAVKIDGSTNAQQRNAAVVSFQENPEVKLFVGNIKAAGTGLTLTAASAVAFLELPWTPGELVQAEDRCHRIGQKNAVNVYYLVADQTIEFRIAEMLDDKRGVLEAVLDGKDAADAPLLTELIAEYKNR